MINYYSAYEHIVCILKSDKLYSLRVSEFLILKDFVHALGRDCVLIFSFIVEMLMTLKSIDKYTNITNFIFKMIISHSNLFYFQVAIVTLITVGSQSLAHDLQPLSLDVISDGKIKGSGKTSSRLISEESKLLSIIF